MGEDPGNLGAIADLRRDIERTRADLGETAAALGAKADVKGRAKERVHEVKEQIASKAPSSAEQAGATVRQNPVPAAAIAAALAGFAIGWILASRRAR